MISNILLNRFNSINPALIKPFFGKCIAVTGASGFIGSLLARYILFCNKAYNANIRLIAFGRNYEKTKAILSDYGDFDFLKINFEEYRSNTYKGLDYIIHAASITKSKIMVEHPALVLNTAINGCKSMLELAKANNAMLLNISSMEAYGNLENGEIADEHKLGYIDLLSPRSCYPEAKRFCECLCAAYTREFSVRTISVRLAQTFGVGILKEENRAFAQFIKSAMLHKNIIIQTSGQSEANYVNSIDCLEAILILLDKGNSGDIYNIVDPRSHRTILNMAELVSKAVSDGTSKVIPLNSYDNSSGYAPDVHLKMSANKIQKLGWKPKTTVNDSILELRDYIIEQDFM